MACGKLVFRYCSFLALARLLCYISHGCAGLVWGQTFPKGITKLILALKYYYIAHQRPTGHVGLEDTVGGVTKQPVLHTVVVH